RSVAAIAHDVDEPGLRKEPREQGALGDHVGRLLDDPPGALALGAKPQQVEEELPAGALRIGVEPLIEARERRLEALALDEAVQPAKPGPLKALPPKAPHPAQERPLRDLARQQPREAALLGVKAALDGDRGEVHAAPEEPRDHMRAAAPRAAHEDDRRGRAGWRCALVSHRSRG